MPPSGYSQSAVLGVATFLKVTLGDLKQEVKSGKHSSLKVGLAFEIDKISKVEGTKDLRPCESGILGITKDFYQQVLLLGEEEALRQVNKDVLSLHIDEEDKLARRSVIF